MQKIFLDVVMFRWGIRAFMAELNAALSQGFVVISDPDKIVEHRFLGLRTWCKALVQKSDQQK